MAIWYVDDAGSNANDGKTSGNPKKYLWLDDGNSALFNEAADEDKPAAGDLVLVLENHSEDYGVVYKTITDNAKGTAAAPIKVVTVDSLASPTAYGSKANSLLKTTTGSGEDLVISGFFYIQGFECFGGDQLHHVASNQDITFQDCELTSNRPVGYGNVFAGQNAVYTLLNCDSSWMTVAGRRSSRFSWQGGTALDTKGLTAADEHGFTEVRGVDLSACTEFVSAGHLEQGNPLKFSRCKFEAAPTLVSGTITGGGMIFDHCDDADEYYWFEEHKEEGAATFDSSNARTATYDGTNKYSVLMSSNTVVSGDLARGLRIKLVELQGIDLTSETTLTIELSQYNAGGAPAALTEHEFWVEIESVDGTDLALGQRHRSNSDTGFWDTSPDDLAISSETWTQISNITKQSVALTLAAVTGADNVSLAVWAYLSKASADVNVCPEVDIT